MIIDLTNEMVFGFGGPNLCLLGNEDDFKKLAQSISDLTAYIESYSIELTKLGFDNKGDIPAKIFFTSKNGSSKLGVFDEKRDLIFELDSRYWERIFKFFVFCSWDNDSSLDDLDLKQECNFICSSEF